MPGTDCTDCGGPNGGGAAQIGFPPPSPPPPAQPSPASPTPSPLSPLPLPPSPPAGPGLCSNECTDVFQMFIDLGPGQARNGRCEDGGRHDKCGNERVGIGQCTTQCGFGTDCADCGVREFLPPPPDKPSWPPFSPSPPSLPSPPSPPPYPQCNDECPLALSNLCDDGAGGACKTGTDCSDCGGRLLSNTCVCQGLWSADEYHSSCVGQEGCPSLACDSNPRSWCLVANPGCDQDERSPGLTPWAFCDSSPPIPSESSPPAPPPLFPCRLCDRRLLFASTPEDGQLPCCP